MASHHFETLYTWDTILSADSTEWCPLSPFQSVFVCGTYQIEKTEDDTNPSPATTRHGTINVFKLSSTKKLEPHQVLSVPAVLDTKWCHVRIMGKVVLAVASATGELIVYQLKENYQLEFLDSCNLVCDSPGEILTLSLDWATVKSSENTSKNEMNIIVSDSKGRIHLFVMNCSLKLMFIKAWHGHEYEAWISSFNYWEPSTVFSGGDDCKLKGWDLRTSLDKPSFVNNSHEAGVTSLHCNPYHEHILASGSYDEYFRLWDLRSMKNPLHTTNLHGGIWRLKWDPHCHEHLLAACMFGGFKVICCSNTLLSACEPTIMAQSENHESLAYGADWSFLNKDDVSFLFKNCSDSLFLVSTCSFYDHRLSVSLIKPVAN